MHAGSKIRRPGSERGSGENILPGFGFHRGLFLKPGAKATGQNRNAHRTSMSYGVKEVVRPIRWPIRHKESSQLLRARVLSKNDEQGRNTSGGVIGERLAERILLKATSRVNADSRSAPRPVFPAGCEVWRSSRETCRMTIMARLTCAWQPPNATHALASIRPCQAVN